jgi:hypothetical protein
VLALLLFPAACQSVSTGLADNNVPPIVVPDAVKAPCAAVVAIPKRSLTSAETARLWGQDRAALGDCGRRHKALADVVAIMETVQ